MKHSPLFFLYHKSSIVAFLTIIPSSLHRSSSVAASKGNVVKIMIREVVRTLQYNLFGIIFIDRLVVPTFLTLFFLKNIAIVL